MFNLEQSIAEWRQQMLAAGIKAAELEELELHLHEEIGQQMRLGMGERAAFHLAAQNVGQSDCLRNEFKKAGGLNERLLPMAKGYADFGLLAGMAFAVFMTVCFSLGSLRPIVPVFIPNNAHQARAVLAMYHEFAGGRFGNAGFGYDPVCLQCICLAEILFMCMILRFAAARPAAGSLADLSFRKHTARFGQWILGFESLFIILMPLYLFYGLFGAFITCSMFVLLLRKHSHLTEVRS